MILLEFAAQGVRGVAPPGGRATLRPGYNVLAAEGGALRRLLEALLHPDARDGEALPRATGAPAGAPVRAGLTLVGDDRVTYRLVRDFAAGAQLHRFDPEKRSFALVAQDLAGIAAFLRSTVGVAAPARHGALLALSASELPSRASGAPAAASAAPQRPALTAEQAKKRAAQLRAELERARVAERLQYQLDGLHAQQFRLQETLQAGAKLREGLEKAEAARAELGRAADIAARLGDHEAKLAAYEKATARREEAAAKMAAEREALADAETRGAPAPLWRDPLFWAGTGGGAGVALGGALGAALHPDLRYLALLDVPAFGWAAWRALQWVSRVEAFERVARRRRVVEEWEKKVEAQYEKDTGEIRAAMKALELTKPADLREALARAADADAVVAEWRRRVDEWEASPGARSALGERAALDEAIRAVDAKLQGEAGGFVRDVRSVEAELQRVESEAAAPAPAAAAPAIAQPRPAAGGGDPLRALLERAGSALGASPAAAARAVAGKASQTLAGLSFQRLQSLSVDERGNVQVQSGGRASATLSLPPADRDLVFLSLKLAFMEQALAAGKAVAVAEDAFGGLSEGARRFAARLLKQIAKPGQLLHATADAAFREAADHAT